ncbi:hypothetical protein [Sorangium sp. So ce124]|uniref:hypothetical protein n=1 Tax=Sorangium sp. So ce124 TaxID=3133280 RepID=UPI003F5E0336
MLSEHHAYEPSGRVLHLDDGRRRRAGALGNVLTTVADHGCANCVLRDGERATAVPLYAPSAVAAATDGGIYVADTFHHRVHRVGTDGVIEARGRHRQRGGSRRRRACGRRQARRAARARARA